MGHVFSIKWSDPWLEIGVMATWLLTETLACPEMKIRVVLWPKLGSTWPGMWVLPSYGETLLHPCIALSNRFPSFSFRLTNAGVANILIFSFTTLDQSAFLDNTSFVQFRLLEEGISRCHRNSSDCSYCDSVVSSVKTVVFTVIIFLQKSFVTGIADWSVFALTYLWRHRSGTALYSG